IAQQALKPERQVEQPSLPLPAAAQLFQPRLHLERSCERKVLALLGLRIELGDAVGLREGEIEHAPDVLDGLLSLERAEGDDLRHTLCAVLLAHVANHLVTPDEAEI